MTGGAVPRSGGRPTAAAATLLEDVILDHATAAFLRQGYAATSIEAIARQARVAKRTIYARWQNKAALFLAVLRRLVSGWLSSANTWQEADGLEAALNAAAQSILTIGLTPEAIALHRLVIAESGRFPQLKAIMDQAGVQEGVRRIAALLDQAIIAGKLPPIDTAFAAEQFQHLVLAGPQRRALGLGVELDAAERDAWGKAAVRLFLSGCFWRSQPA